MLGRGDPVIRRLQQAFSQEEPATELAAIMQRAARYQEPPDGEVRLLPNRGLTQADLMAARQREPAAVTRVYTAYAPALFRFFMASIGDRHEAQDLTGSVFLSAIEALPGFRGPVEALGGWLFRIARHDLYDYRRKQARSPGLAPLAEEEPPVGSVEDSLVMAALQQLSPDQREVLLLRMFGGLTAHEVAAALGKTTGAVKALQHRGLASLARLLGLRSSSGWSDRRSPSPDPAHPGTQNQQQA
jgi:RNA polymerase sigma-70 factor (ECF subfamily)